jgi:hypothetical protein
MPLNGCFRASNSAHTTSASARELPFAADPLQRQVSVAEFGRAYGNNGSSAGG